VFWKLKYRVFLIKGLNFYLSKKKHITIKNLNNYLGYKVNNNYILNLTEIIFWTYILIFFLQNVLRKNAKVLFATKFEVQQTVFDSLVKNSELQFQLLKVFTKWVGGCLSNFSSTRWFYFFNRIKFYKECPDLLVLLEKKAADSLVAEAYALRIPVISYTGFNGSDTQLSYLLFGGDLGLDSKRNNFFFFIYLLKNMLSLELSLKKKQLSKVVSQKKTVRKQGFFRRKKNKAYRLFSGRGFNLWRSHLRFNVKLKLLSIKFQLIAKLLLRHFKINKHFFQKQSTLSYIKKLRSGSYTISCKKNLRFFYIIERRILVILGRMHITRIVLQDQVRFLILGGYVSVDNEIVSTPSYLAPHSAIIRILKTIPRGLSKVPKSLILNSLRWFYNKRSRANKEIKFWSLHKKQRPWHWAKKRVVRRKKQKSVDKNAWRTKRLAIKKSKAVVTTKKKGSLREKKNYADLCVVRKKIFLKIIRTPTPYFREIRKRVQRFRKIYRLNRKPIKLEIPKFPIVFTRRILSEIPKTFCCKLKKLPFFKKTNLLKWQVFFKLLNKNTFLTKNQKNQLEFTRWNKHTQAKKFFFAQVFCSKSLLFRQFKNYQYKKFFKKLTLNLRELPFQPKKRKEVKAQPLDQQRILKRLLFSQSSKIRRFSFFSLQFRKKKYKRNSSRSNSRQFFTNMWLIAFIFTKPKKIKKIWYSKLLTRRVLSFFCTNFW
jgi:hypothetical protein